MPVNLQKGESVNLTKEAEATGGLHKVIVGAGWDMAVAGPKLDVDLFAALLGADGKKYGAEEDSLAFFNNKEAAGRSVFLHKDNRTGEGEGDDESISIDFDAVPADVSRIVIIASIYEAKARGQKLADLKNAYVRVAVESGAHGDLKDGGELSRFTVSGEGSETVLTFGDFFRDAGGWSFKATGERANGTDAVLSVFGL